MNRSDENGLCFTPKPFSVVPGLDVVVVVEMVVVVIEVVAVVVEMVAVVVEMVAVVVEIVVFVIEVVGVEETAALVIKLSVVVIEVVVVSSTIRLHSTGGKSWYSGSFGRIMWPKLIERPKARLREALL